jgi:hypothetical protein
LVKKEAGEKEERDVGSGDCPRREKTERKVKVKKTGGDQQLGERKG